MRQSTRLIINVSSNYFAFAVYGAVNFFLAGYLARVFGKDLFGIAMLVTSFTIITEFLGRGICQALTKHIAADTQKKDTARFHGLVNTSFVWLLACSVVGAVICVILSVFIDKISNIPPELIGQAKIGMLLVGLKVLVCFPLNTFQSILWSHQRYDLTNLARTIAIILRAVLVVVWFEFVAAGLTQLICITIFTTLLEEAIWIYYSYKITEELIFRLQYVSIKMFRLLFSFGGFIFIIVLSNLLGFEAIKWMMNLEMPVREVGAYGLIATLAMFAGNMVRSIANVLMPTASNLHARNMHDKNIKLAGLSTKYALVVAGLFFLVPLFLLEPFLTLWVGNTYSSDYLSKVAIAGIILLIGQYIMDSSACSTQMATGMGKVAFLSMTNLCWAVIGLTCVWIYLHWFNSSIIGVSLIITIARITGAIVKLIYGIKVIGIAAKGFIIDSLIKPTILCFAVCSAGYGLAKAINVYKIPEFIIAVMILGILYVCGTWLITFATEERQGVIHRLIEIRKNLKKKDQENLAVNA
jgi:O-antigen/teichoic acid export membrane protein